jgi:hypothetical protein
VLHLPAVVALQKYGVNVLYQTTIMHNPQIDVQGVQRLYRTGQTATDVYVYRIMMDSYAERRSLQRQVVKAAGWRQRLYNAGDACKLLDLPESWQQGEPDEIDNINNPSVWLDSDDDAAL